MKKESSKSKKHVMKQVSIEDMKMSEGLADTALVIRKATNMTASIHATSHGLGGVQQATAALTTTNTSSSIEDTVQQSAYKKPIKRLSSVEKNIWDEYYPLLASNSTSHNSSLGFSGMFSAEIVTAYKHAILAYVIALMTMVVLSITGLVLSKLWDLHPSNICVTLSITLWIISPVIASFAARQVASQRLQFCAAGPRWSIRPFRTLFKCFHFPSMSRLLVLSYAIPLLCTAIAFIVNVVLHVIHPLNPLFLTRIERVFRTDIFSYDVGDNWWLVYMLWTIFGGIFWDFIPPRRYDFGLGLPFLHHPRGGPVGCSWFILSLVEEIGWSGTLYPACDVVFANSSCLASSVTGIIWALWHWPFILAEYYSVIPEGTGMIVGQTVGGHATGQTIVYCLLLCTLFLVGSRWIMCWIQGNNNYSIWTSVVYHASQNLYINSVFNQLGGPTSGKTEWFPYFTGKSNLCLVIAVWFSAVILAHVCRLPPIVRKMFRKENHFHHRHRHHHHRSNIRT